MDNDQLKLTSKSKNKYIFAAASLVVIGLAVYFLFLFNKGPKQIKPEDVEAEVKNASELEAQEKPYVTLTPTSDGAEIIISIENMGAFDKMEYELTYLADNPQVSTEKITRGSTGTDVNTKDQKYKKSLLLGTASRGVRSPDKGVTEGKLALHMFKGETEYLSETQWDLSQIGPDVTTLSSRDEKIKIEGLSLEKNYWAIIADTVSAPTSDQYQIENVVLPVYGAFSVGANLTKQAKVIIKQDSDISSHQLYAYSHQDSTVQKIDSKYDSLDKTISANISNFATFVVVTSQ